METPVPRRANEVGTAGPYGKRVGGAGRGEEQSPIGTWLYLQ